MWWSELLAKQDMTSTQRQMFTEAFDFGLKEGLLIPIPVSTDDDDRITEYAYGTLGGDLIKSDEMENTLRLLMTAGHSAARKIYLQKAKSSPNGLVEEANMSHDFHFFCCLLPLVLSVTDI